jgi:hypothetical protein
MLAEARTALKSSEGESSRANQAKAILVAVKTLNRAGGFLEAISIVNPDLGSELIEEFEAFAREIQVLSGEPAQLVRALKERRERAERRGPDRRLAGDRRTRELTVVAERRTGSERRTSERRVGPRRVHTDRRSDPSSRWNAN